MLKEANDRALTPTALVEHVISIVCAYVGNNSIVASELPTLIKNVHTTLAGLSNSGNQTVVAPQNPAVPIKRSVTPEYIVCLEDGKKLKMLKRYLRSRHNLSVDQYRAKWGLPSDYPMVAPNYAAKRSEFAKKFGLGKRDAPAKLRKRS